LAEAHDAAEHDEAAEGEEGPLRLCAVTRQTGPPERLIRFVAAPDGEIVPDLACRLPGRGVWVTADRGHIEQAARQNVFAKSLKRQVKVPNDLAGRLETLLLRQTINALSIANKAGVVTTGFSQVDAALQKGGVVILVHGSDAAAGGSERLDRKHAAIAGSHGRSPQICIELTIEQISLAIGGLNVVHAALNHGGAAAKFATEAGRLKRYRSGLPPLEGQDSASLARGTKT
jgi:uncharacterized protein